MELVKSAAPSGVVLQLKIRLLGLSPMVWRRVLVPESMSLHELHGVVQLAMGWEGIHLFEFAVRGARYVGPYLCGEPVDRALSSFRFRRNARFRYVYDMSCWWEHEIRVEERVCADAGKRSPRCIGGAGACPPYEHLPNWPTQRLRPLLDEFALLLAEHRLYKRMFAIL